MHFLDSITDSNLTCDVLVIGGGPGGSSAAVMAAREGARVLLVEQTGVLGGTAVHSEISPFMNNHAFGQPLDRPVYIDWGRKMYNYLTPKWKSKPFDETMNDFLQTKVIQKDVAALALEELVLENNVQILYHHTFVDCEMDGTKIKACIFHSKSGFCRISARCYVDATGDGDVAVAAGCEAEFGNAEGFAQPMTTCFKLSGIDKSRWPSGADIDKLFFQAKADGIINCLREDVLFFPTRENDVVHFNTTRVCQKSGVNGRELSEAELDGHRQVREFLNFFRTRVPGCENAELRSMASKIGVRESRRIRGLMYQTQEDFFKRQRYADAIARVHYIIDIHNPMGTGTERHEMPDSEYYEISLRALIPLKCDNLMIGCRAISFDHALHSSSRIMPVVCSIGQAAGMTAAEAAATGRCPADLDRQAIRRRLIQHGANLA